MFQRAATTNDWLKREPSKQSLRKAEIMDKNQEIYDNSYQIYGAPKITKELKKLGYDTAERTVTRYMQELGIRACWVKPYTVTTISEDFSDDLKNILDRNFSPEVPNAVWCTDITYIPTANGFAYLSRIVVYVRRTFIPIVGRSTLRFSIWMKPMVYPRVTLRRLILGIMPA